MKESNMGRKCSHCRSNGHNSRTCSSPRTPGVKLFGVHIHTAPHLTKSSSMECSPSCSLAFIDETTDKNPTATGYLSDGLMMCPSQERRTKGAQWTEEEHNMFLVGLERLGKGDWRGISRSFVSTRTPTQVASHAQKYFLSLDKKHRRSRGLFGELNSGREVHVGDLQVHTNIKTDLKYAFEQETQVPWCLSLMPNSPALMSSDSLMARSTQVQLPLPDLKLSISSLPPNLIKYKSSSQITNWR